MAKPTLILNADDAWKYVRWYTLTCKDSEFATPIEWWDSYRQSNDSVRRGMIEDLGAQKFWEYRELLKSVFTEAKSTRRLEGHHFKWKEMV